MKKIIKIFALCFAVLLVLSSCSVSDKKTTTTEKQSLVEPEPDLEVMSVKEVLATEDYTHVLFEGIVTGYDYGKRHMIIEDVDGSCAIQLYKNPGYQKAKVGDLVRVDGYRTYDKGLDRVTPNSLEVISSGNPCTADNPTVIDASELSAWTNANRTNAGIMFKTYTFTNVEIVEMSGSYVYIDNQYDEEGGRGIKIGLKNDCTFVDMDELNLVQGQKYNITAIIYGVSDDFTDESRDGVVLRLSVLSVDDVQLVVENTDEATVVVSGQRSFLIEDNDSKPDFTTYFQVIDPVDGAITVTSEMITENVNMTVAGTYPVTFTYTNTAGTVVTKTINIYVTENGLSVSEAIDLVPEFIDLHVHGVVVGWTYNDSQKTAMIIEDPATGEAIEIWTNNKSAFQKLNVGDHVVIYSTALGYEKELPRLNGTLTVCKTIETGVALTAPTVIEDLAAWTAELAETKANFFGRYTFEAEFIAVDGNYAYFYRATEETGNIIQVGLYQSVISYNFVSGMTYKVTAVAAGISNAYSDLAEKSIVIRMSVMNESDIEIVVGEEATVVVTGDTHILSANGKPDFTTYFTVVDPEDGKITVTSDMITESVDINTPGVYDVTFTYTNSKNTTTTKTVKVTVSQYGISVSEAIKLLGTDTPALINGYVAGFVKNSDGNHTAIILQDTETGECLEFWANDHSAYRSTWNTFAIGDHVIISTDKIKDNKGLPRAGDTKGYTAPVMLGESYKISTGNTVKSVEIPDMGAFLQDAIENGTNILGKYTYTGVVNNDGGYLYSADKGDGYKLNLGLYNSPVSATFENGKKYSVTFVILGYNKALSTEEDITLRIAIMNEGDVEKVVCQHNVVTDEAVPATCTTTGLTEGSHCSVCNEVLVAQKEVSATGHTTVIDSAVAPTCTTTGLTEGSHCSVCSEVLEAQEAVSATGHTSGDAVVENSTASTCGQQGSYDEVVYCTVCSEELSRVTHTVDAAPHSHVGEVTTAPTCTTAGVKTYTCSVCGDSYTEEISATGHTSGAGVVENEVAATCTAGGSCDNVVYCTVCDKELSRETITTDATGHTEVTDAAVAPTHTATGLTEGSHCSVCNEVLVAQKTVTFSVEHTLSVSEAIKLLGKGTATYINGYVAGYSINGTIVNAVILQDTVTGECIEFWGNNSSEYADVWASYEVGDQVIIHASSIVSEKGLPRANATVTPIEINGSYKLSTDNELKVTEITDMDAFLAKVYQNDTNVLGVYTCTVKVADSGYFHQITTTKGKLRIQLKDSATTPTMEVGSTYTIKFVLTGYSKALTETGNLYVRVSVMDENDVTLVTE